MVKVLVVDDDAAIRDLAVTVLQREGFIVLTARDGEEALLRARTEQPALIVLDLMLPRIDGFEVCRTLRGESDIPIMMLTAKGDDVDKIIGLEIGADDYLTKPFIPREMVARARAILRRSTRARRSPPILRLGCLVVDRPRREAQVAGRTLDLRPKEFDLLTSFVENAGLVRSREQLLEDVWGYDVPGETRTVDVHVNHLRRKLGGSGITIETLRGVGYKLVAT